jgi:hypothetical protein
LEGFARAAISPHSLSYLVLVSDPLHVRRRPRVPSAPGTANDESRQEHIPARKTV